MNRSITARYLMLGVLLLMLGISGCISVPNSGVVPDAREGVLDLQGLDQEQLNLVPLAGQWEFYWQRLYTSPDFKSGQLEASYIDVPANWNKQLVGGRILPGQGYGTYRLVVHTDESSGSLEALYIPVINTAYKMWVDGELIAANGTVGTSKETMVPQNMPQIVLFNASSQEIEIIVQVSNFMNITGGMGHSITLGEVNAVYNVVNREEALQHFMLGIALIMGFYHLLLYLLRKQEKANLYFSLMCLLFSIRTLFVGTMIFMRWFPNFNWQLATRIEYFTWIMGVLAFLAFLYHLYPEKVDKRVVKLVNLVGFGFGMLIIMLPAIYFSSINIVFQLLFLALAIYALVLLLQPVLFKNTDTRLVVMGLLLLVIAVITDMFFLENNLQREVWVAAGLIVLVFSNSMALSVRYTEAFESSQNLMLERDIMVETMKKMNQDLETKVKLRTAELKNSVEKLNQEIKERTAAQEQLKVFASTDIMTGLYNRATGLAMLEKHLQLAERNAYMVTVCFIDIDNLKEVNDKHGHMVGDQLIITSSHIIKNNVRESDFVFRMGGDEFVAVFPQCSQQEAKLIWKRIIEKFDENNDMAALGIKISISYGLAEFTPGSGTKMSELIDKADAAMYQHKISRSNSGN